MSSFPPALTAKDVERAASELAAIDPDLCRAVERLGPPPLWDRAPGFPTLVHIVLEQQVSLASARSAFDKLTRSLPSLAPEVFLTLDDRQLKDIGFSGQKGRYCRALAGALLDGSLDLERVAFLPDDEARAELERVAGIGPWTSSIYILMALLRPDVWPPGDLALAAAVRDLKGLEHRPSSKQLLTVAETWRPWRSVAARILWNQYLNPE